jgi:hypothetical protein
LSTHRRISSPEPPGERGVGIAGAGAGLSSSLTVIPILMTVREGRHPMDNDSRARLRVAALIYCMVNAVVFGIGVIVVMSIPALASSAFFWIPAVVASSFVISAPLSWFIAPWMMLRFARTPII